MHDNAENFGISLKISRRKKYSKPTKKKCKMNVLTNIKQHVQTTKNNGAMLGKNCIFAALILKW